MIDDSTDLLRSRMVEEKLDRIAAELRQIRYLMWFLSLVGVVAVISMLPQLLTNVFYAAVFIAALAGIWFLATKAARIPLVRKWRNEHSTAPTPDRDAR